MKYPWVLVKFHTRDISTLALSEQQVTTIASNLSKNSISLCDKSPAKTLTKLFKQLMVVRIVVLNFKKTINYELITHH